MAYKIIPEDYTVRLNRVRAELVRRNGYGDLSGYSSIDFPSGTPITAGGYITAPVFNTLIRGLEYIDPSGLPGDAVPLETYINESDMSAIDAAILLFEAQPRGATSNNDCLNLCSGMCVSQCTTACLSTCTGTCSATCTGGCADTCSTTCTASCTGTCTGACTSCSGGCTGSCTGTCTRVCNWSCTGGCSGCSGTCNTSCTGTPYTETGG